MSRVGEIWNEMTSLMNELDTIDDFAGIVVVAKDEAFPMLNGALSDDEHIIAIGDGSDLNKATSNLIKLVTGISSLMDIMGEEDTDDKIKIIKAILKGEYDE